MFLFFSMSTSSPTVTCWQKSRLGPRPGSSTKHMWYQLIWCCITLKINIIPKFAFLMWTVLWWSSYCEFILEYELSRDCNESSRKCNFKFLNQGQTLESTELVGWDLLQRSGQLNLMWSRGVSSFFSIMALFSSWLLKK